MEDGTEMEWMSFWHNGFREGANADAILIGTFNDGDAGCWFDYGINTGQTYICEKKDQVLI